jgi:phospholipid transport system substrate-binding protein
MRHDPGAGPEARAGRGGGEDVKTTTRANGSSAAGSGALSRGTRPATHHLGRATLAAALGLGVALLCAGAPPLEAAPRAAAGAPGDPMAVVRGVVEEALAILRDRATPVAVRRARLRRLTAPVFDFTTMSRFALGYHWRDLDAAQRAEFVSVFTHFIQDSYVSRINEYSGQDVEFGKVTFDGADYAQVRTRIVEDGKPPTAVNYRLERQHGVWRIYDVTVENLSILANYRNQFGRVMSKGGYTALIGDLRRKQRALASSLDGASAEPVRVSD